MGTTRASSSDTEAVAPGEGRRVVVGVDGSPGSRAALVWALVAAARRGAGVDVVGSYDLELYYAGGQVYTVPDPAGLRDELESLVSGMVEEVRADPAVVAVQGAADVDVRVVVASGPPAQVLVDRSAGAALLVVGSRGRGTVRSVVLGSVALHCATHAACPIVVVHPAGEAPAERRVVVGVDGSDGGRAALTAAFDEAARSGAEVEAVAAYVVEDYWADLSTVVVPDEATIREELRTQTEQLVGELVAERAAAGLPVPEVRTSVVRGGASDVLLERSRSAELLVVGSHSRGPLRGLLLGSVALWCAVHSAGPVMVVRPTAVPGDDVRVPEAAPAAR